VKGWGFWGESEGSVRFGLGSTTVTQMSSGGFSTR
jgi:hypothetical protein